MMLDQECLSKAHGPKFVTQQFVPGIFYFSGVPQNQTQVWFIGLYKIKVIIQVIISEINNLNCTSHKDDKVTPLILKSST